MKTRNKLFALVLALAMIVTYMPALAFADGNNQTFDVDEEVYYLNGTDLNSHHAIPGMTLILKAFAYDWTWDDDPVKSKPFSYSFSLGDVTELRYWDDEKGHDEILKGYEAGDFVAINSIEGSDDAKSAYFKSIDEVKSGRVPDEMEKLDDAFDMGFRIHFTVTATRDGESHSREFDIWVSKDYYEVEPIDNPLEGMAYGSSVTIEPKLFHITGPETINPVTDNVEWKLTKNFDDEGDNPWNDGWDSIVALDAQDKDFPVTVTQEGKYTITRKTFDEARVTLWAKYQVPEGDGTRDEYEDSEFWVDRQENDLSKYDIEVEGADRDSVVRVSELNNISLIITVSDGRHTLPVNVYDIHILKESWGADDKQTLTEVENGQLALDQDTGTATFIIYATARDGSGYSGHTFFEKKGDRYEGRYFDIYHDKTLSPFNPKIEFAGYEAHDGQRPMSQYYWFTTADATTVPDSIKVSIGGTDLTKDTDYTVHYFAGDGEEPAESQIFDTFPTAVGTYTLLIKAKTGSGYSGKNGTVKFIIMSNEDRQAQEAAENVRNLIEDIRVWDGPEEMNRSAVKPARTAYDMLSANAKALVYDRWYAQLLDAEFIILMDAVDVNNPSEAAVKAARAQYDKASKVNMFEIWMPENLVEKLKAAEKKIADKKKAEEEKAKKDAARNGSIGKGMPTVKIKKVTAKKNKITIKWTKLTNKQIKKSKATHYEIWVSTSSRFPQGATTKEKILKKGKKSWTCSGLKKNKKYYVRIRAIKYVKGAKVTGKWKSKTIKTKKK